jgi:hypothetical protein
VRIVMRGGVGVFRRIRFQDNFGHIQLILSII